MNDLLQWLKGGDLRSDGASNQAAQAVLDHPELFEDLVEGLQCADDVVRGRTADALEKVSRERPDLTVEQFDLIIATLEKDRVMMVQMHLAMILGHLANHSETIPRSVAVLLNLLDDASPFVKSWAIVSLCIIARLYPTYREEITQHVAGLSNDASKAIRAKVRYAVEVLSNDTELFPKGWVKSSQLKEL